MGQEAGVGGLKPTEPPAWMVEGYTTGLPCPPPPPVLKTGAVWVPMGKIIDNLLCLHSRAFLVSQYRRQGRAEGRPILQVRIWKSKNIW